MLALIQDKPIATIEPDEWSDIYSEILAGYTAGTLNNKLRQIRRLHRILVESFNACPLPSDCLPVEDEVDPAVRNSLALPAEIKSLLDAARPSQEQIDPYKLKSRQQSQLYIVCLLLSATGCRIGEVTGLQFRDLMIHGKSVFVRVRLNDYRRIKTLAAARVIPIKLGDDDQHFILDYLKNEMGRLGSVHYRQTRIMLLDLSHQQMGIPIGTHSVRTPITSVLRQASPENLISYDLRKARGTFFQVDTALGRSDYPRPGRPVDVFSLPDSTENTLRLPRMAFARCMVTGQARPRTLNHSYGGLPWVYLVESGRRNSIYLGANLIATLSGVKANSIKSTKSSDRSDTISRLFLKLSDQPLPRRHRKARAADITLEGLATEDIPPLITYLVHARDPIHEEQYPAYGLTSNDYAILTTEANQLMQEAGFAFFASQQTPDGHSNRRSARPRWSSEGRELLLITNEISYSSSNIWSIASAYRKSVHPGAPQTPIVLPANEAQALQKIVKLHVRAIEFKTDLMGTKVSLIAKVANKPVTRQLAWILSAVCIIRRLRQ